MKKLGYDPIIRHFRYAYVDEFNILGYNRNFFCYVLHDYYPNNQFGMDVDEDILKIRKLIYDFQDGYNSTFVASLIMDALKRIHSDLKNTCLIVIPASTQEKTEIRYRIFSNILCDSLGIINSMNAITTLPHEATKGISDGNEIQYFTFDCVHYINRNVLLIDDIRTTGTTYRQVLKKLIDTGARNVIGIILGLAATEKSIEKDPNKRKRPRSVLPTKGIILKPTLSKDSRKELTQRELEMKIKILTEQLSIPPKIKDIEDNKD